MNKNLSLQTLFIIGILFFVGCATTIPIQVQRTPTLDTAGINRVAVMPFETAIRDGHYSRVAQFMTTSAASSFSNMPRFTLVNASEIERLRGQGVNLENYVDALFGGQIIHIRANQDTRTDESRTRDGRVVRTTHYTTEVELQYSFAFTRVQDGSMIGPVTRTRRNSETSQSGYPDELTLLQAIVNSEMNRLYRDVSPYIAIERREMVKDKSKNKDLQASMKEALEHTKSGNYRVALDAYLTIYNSYKSIAAAQNATILYEAMGDFEAGVRLMQRVFNETGNPTAQSVIARLNRIIQDRETIATAFTATSSQRDQVIAYGYSEITKVLPQNARVWIYNSLTDDAMTKDIVDDLEAIFIRNGISIADRQNRDLIDAERRFQMSGEVSDDDFVSVGNAMGVNTIITVAVVGTGGMRRLSVRVLDVERGMPIMQSDTGEGWRL